MMGNFSPTTKPGAGSLHQEPSAHVAKMDPSMVMCKQMMADMEMEKAHMMEMDAKLGTLISNMDSATGDDRFTSMGAVIKELIAQRTMIRTMKTKMDAKMMGHMMMHMKMPMKSGKMECPMMKEMMGD